MYVFARRIFEKMQPGTARAKNGPCGGIVPKKGEQPPKKARKQCFFKGHGPHCYIMATMGQKLPFTSKLTQRNADFGGKKPAFREG
jgi:hypothetical protein